MQEEKEKEPFKPYDVEEKMGAKKKSNKNTNLQIKEYEKRIADRAREMARKVSEAFDAENKPAAEEPISYNIVVVRTEKTQ